jgi:hypothetical protein
MGVAASTQIRTYQSFYRSASACAIKLQEAPLKGRLLALPSNTRLWWKGLKLKNTLAYYDMEFIAAVKGFKVLSPGSDPAKNVKLF